MQVSIHQWRKYRVWIEGETYLKRTDLPLKGAH